MTRAGRLCRSLAILAVLTPLPACTISLEPLPTSAAAGPANLGNCPYVPRNALGRSCRP